MTNASRAPIDLDAFARDLQQQQGTPGVPAAAKGDPLAELARIVGQDDPFRALLAARDERRAEAPAAGHGANQDWQGRIEPSFAPEAPLRETPADAFDQYLASVEQDQTAPAYEAPAEPEVPQDRRSLKRVNPNRRLMTVGAGLAVVAVAVTGALTYKGLHRSISGGVPVIQADTTPLKVAPKVADGVEIPDQNRQIYEPKAKDSQIRIVNREEQPIDIAQATRAAQTGTTTPGGTISGGTVSGGAPLDAFGEPRRVRTVAVKPDTPPPAPPREQPAEAAMPAPIPTMVMPGDEPARPRPVRQAAATPQVPAPAQAEPAAESPERNRVRKATQRLASASADAPLPVAEMPATTASTPTPAASEAAVGGFAVQLGVRNSAGDAQAALRDLQRKFGQLAGKPELIRQAEVNGKTIYRVRVGPLAKAEANSLCSALQGAGGQCFVAKN